MILGLFSQKNENFWQHYCPSKVRQIVIVCCIRHRNDLHDACTAQCVQLKVYGHAWHHYLICIILWLKQKRKHANKWHYQRLHAGLLNYLSLCILSLSLSQSLWCPLLCPFRYATLIPQLLPNLCSPSQCVHTFTDSDGCVFMCIWRCVCLLDLLLIVGVIYKHMFLLFKRLSVWVSLHTLTVQMFFQC